MVLESLRLLEQLEERTLQIYRRLHLLRLLIGSGQSVLGVEERICAKSGLLAHFHVLLRWSKIDEAALSRRSVSCRHPILNEDLHWDGIGTSLSPSCLCISLK